MGDDSQASLALDLSRYSSQDPYSQADIIRAKAVKVFQHVVVPGSFSTLQRALHDTFNEVRLNAIDALFYLGVKQSISELINYVEDENYMVINNTLARLGDLLGKKIESGTKIDELREWWKLHQMNYEQFICYRLGKPINLKKIIFLLKKRSLRDGIIKELKIITGQDFSLNCVGKEPTNTELIENANKWWEREGHQFQVGHLYKYGHEKEIESVF